jgi:imidazolonepropionase-like amidohydrolase
MLILTYAIRTSPVLVFILTLSSLMTLSALGQQDARHDAQVALVGARIYPSPSAPAIPDGVILIEDGTIVSVGATDKIHIPNQTKRIRCAGKTVVAGLWNSHVHFIGHEWDNAATAANDRLTKQMQDMLTQYGFTSVVDTGSALQNTLDLRHKVATGEVPGPRILTAGNILFSKNGLPYYALESLPPNEIKEWKEGEVATPEEAVQLVDRQIAAGADIVKLYAVSWIRRDGKIEPYPMKLSIVKAATNEAHRLGKLVFAHPSTTEGLLLVIDGHVDVLAHTSEEPALWEQQGLASRLKAANVTLIPTLTLFDRDDDFALIEKEVTSYRDLGGRIIFGTDVGYIPAAATTKEFRYLSNAGLTFPEILATLTTTPASYLGFSDRVGQIKPGMDADLTVLEGDPARNIDAFAEVAMTMRHGAIIFMAKTSPTEH